MRPSNASPRSRAISLAALLLLAVGSVATGWWFSVGMPWPPFGPREAAANGFSEGAIAMDDPRFQAALPVAANSESPSTPGDVLLPEPAEPAATESVTYLTSDGSVLVDFLSTTEGSWDSLNQDNCDATKAGLEALAPPDQLAELASQIPDEPSRDVMTNLVSFTVRHVASCGADRSAASEVAWNWAVAYRRLSDLGVVVP